MADPWLWPVGLGALGAIIGSFIATLVIRWPQGRSVTRGRSRCDSCDAVLGPGELVPLFSAVLARGRCRRCAAPLAPRDLVTFWLPDRLTILLAAGGLFTGAIGIAPSLSDRLIGGAAGFAVLFGVGQAYRLVRKREGLGGGDPKLFGAIGLWLGWTMLPAVLLLAALTGLALVLVGHVAGRPARLDDRVPFGALLAIAAYPAWLFLLGSSP